MIKDVYGHLLTGSLIKKYIMKVRPFSSAKISDIEYYITSTKRDFDPGICILVPVGTNDLTLDDTPDEITEHIVNIATFLKTENNKFDFNIVPRGDSKKDKWLQNF